MEQSRRKHGAHVAGKGRTYRLPTSLAVENARSLQEMFVAACPTGEIRRGPAHRSARRSRRGDLRDDRWYGNALLVTPATTLGNSCSRLYPNEHSVAYLLLLMTKNNSFKNRFTPASPATPAYQRQRNSVERCGARRFKYFRWWL